MAQQQIDRTLVSSILGNRIGSRPGAAPAHPSSEAPRATEAHGPATPVAPPAPSARPAPEGRAPSSPETVRVPTVLSREAYAFLRRESFERFADSPRRQSDKSSSSPSALMVEWYRQATSEGVDPSSLDAGVPDDGVRVAVSLDPGVWRELSEAVIGRRTGGRVTLSSLLRGTVAWAASRGGGA